MPGVGTSLVLIAVGAILKYAVTAHVSGLNLQTIGVILMIVGIVGLVLSLLWMFGLDRRRGAAAEPGVVRDREVVRDRDVY
jgi:hypothetical protein